MKGILLVIATASSLASTNEFRIPVLKLGTNEYQKAVITRRNALEAVVRYDGGITKAKIADLPEPMRSIWLDEDAAKKLEKDRQEQAKKGEKLIKAADEASNAAMVQANYRTIEGKLVPVASFTMAVGRVERQINGGLLIKQPARERVKVGTRRGAFGLRQDDYDYREVPGTGIYRFIRNAPAKPTGESVWIKAHRTGKTIKVGGVDAELWDCGTVPKPTLPASTSAKP